MDHKTIVNAAIDNIRLLNQIDCLELDVLIYDNKEEYEKLLMAIESFLTNTCGNRNKLQEKRTQLTSLIKSKENDTKPVIIHVKNSYGPDLIIRENNKKDIHIELKSSIVKLKNNYKSNWVFTINLSTIFENWKTDNEKFITQKLLEYLKNKYDGQIVLQSIHDGSELFSSTLSSSFISLLFTNMIMKNFVKLKNMQQTVINLGSSYCKKHSCYHRIEKYEKYDNLLNIRISTEKYDMNLFTSQEWKEINADSLCKLNK
jgi:hypothetical protein